MDEDDFEGTAGSDFEDLMNIECDVDDDDDVLGIDKSLMMSDDEQVPFEDIVLEDKGSEIELREIKLEVDTEEEVPIKTEEAKKPAVKTVETKKPAIKAKETKKAVETIKTSVKLEETKKPSIKAEEAKKTDVKAEETKKPVNKVNEKEIKTDATLTSATKVEGVKKEPDTKLDEAPKDSSAQETVTETDKPDKKDDIKLLETKTNGGEKKDGVNSKNIVDDDGKNSDGGVPVIVIDDDNDNVTHVSDVESDGIIEGDVDDFPEEWMVIDEMEEDAEKMKETSEKNTETSRNSSSQRSDSEKYRSQRRSRSRSRTRRRDTRDQHRRTRTSDRERGKDSKPSSQKQSSPGREKDVDKKFDSNNKSKSNDSSRKTDDKDKKIDDSKKILEDSKTEHALKNVDPFKNMRDTIEKFDKNWRWNLKISPIEVNDLKNEKFRQIIGLANDSILVFNMQNDKKSKYGFLDLCLSSASDIRQAIDKLSLLRMENNFIHVSISHKMFDKNAGVESALLKVDMREGKHITAQPVKGTEKQRKINISNGPKGMSKLMLDAVFSKITQIVITENAQTETSTATMLCANPESVGGMLRFYQSVVIGGRRLQLQSEVTPPPKPKDSPQLEQTSSSVSSSSRKGNTRNSSRESSRDSNGHRRNNSDNKRMNIPVNDGLLGPMPQSVFSTAMGSGRGFENMDFQERHRAILAREEAERKQEAMKRLGITVGVDTFMEGPGPLQGVQELIQQKTEHMQMEAERRRMEMNKAQMFDNNLRQDMYRQDEMQRLQMEIEMSQQAELRERQERQQQELILRMQREQQLERERLEQEKMERMQRERKEREQRELERLEQERLEKERIERERLECMAREQLERERLNQERLERERREKERLEKERKEREMKERQERERKERERQEEMRRKEREAKMRPEQHHLDRYQSTNRSDSYHYNQWQQKTHLQNEQDQFEKEIGLQSRRVYDQSNYNYEQPVEEEKKNLHQKIREQWERQVAEASRMGNQQNRGNNQKDGPRNENSGNWSRGGGATGGNWHEGRRSDEDYGGMQSMNSAGLMSKSSNQGSMSAYTTAVREYGQPAKRSNPWGEEQPSYGEKRSREDYVRYPSYPNETGDYKSSGEQWEGERTRDRPYEQQRGWGQGSSTESYSRQGRADQQQYRSNW